MLYWHFGVYFDINLKLLSGKNTQKVNIQIIRDSKNWVFDEQNVMINHHIVPQIQLQYEHFMNIS